jgi:hypothetical protein
MINGPSRDIDEESTDRAGTQRPSHRRGRCRVLFRHLGIDPETVLARDGIEAQTGQAVINLAAILDAAKASRTSLSGPPSSVWMSRTSRPSTRYAAATCPIPTSPFRTSPFRTSQSRPATRSLISIDAMAIKTNA